MVKMDCQMKEVLHEGYGRVRKRGILSKWSERWLVLSRQGRQRTTTWLEIHTNRRTCKLDLPPTFIQLDDVVDVSTVAKSGRLTIVGITFQNGTTKRFGFSYLESRQWYDCIRRHCLGYQGDNAGSAGSTDTPNDDDGDDDDGDDEVFQNDEPICDVLTPKQETFNVWIKHSPKLTLSGACTLTVTEESVRVVAGNEDDAGAPTVTWPLASLRRYGYDGHRFTFEAGRRCTTGEGIFTFKTTEGEAIQTIVQMNTELLASETKAVRSQSVLITRTGGSWQSPSHNMSVTSCFSDSFAY